MHGTAEECSSCTAEECTSSVMGNTHLASGVEGIGMQHSVE